MDSRRQRNYNPLRRDVAVHARRVDKPSRLRDVRPARRREHIVFRRVMVGPVEAVSLAKPSKPADEEKFALLISAGMLSSHASVATSTGGAATADGAQHSVASCYLRQMPRLNEFQPGDRLLMQAAAQLERRASVTAKLRHQVAIGGQAALRRRQLLAAGQRRRAEGAAGAANRRAGGQAAASLQ